MNIIAISNHIGAGSSVVKAFVFTVQTDNAGTSAADQFTIPITSATPYNIKTSDGQSITGATGATTLTFPSAGEYEIKISESCEGWRFNNGGDKFKILDISNWGVFKNTVTNAFLGAVNMTCSATYAPVNPPTTMNSIFSGCKLFNGTVQNWDVSGVSDFFGCFSGALIFNQPLDLWDTSSSVTFKYMFNGCSLFNQPINSWNTNSIVGNGYSNMFQNAISFNQPLDTWNLSGATDINSMFSGASSFNQDLSLWNTSNVTNMAAMFAFTTSFNHPSIGNWDVSNVTNMAGMFNNADSFNQPLGSWTINSTSPVIMSYMFVNNDAFNQDIGAWDVSQVTSMESMFRDARGFNNGGSSNINNWNTGNVTNMKELFYHGGIGAAGSFNQPIGNWNTSNVTTMRSMFYYNTAFDQPIGGWDVSNVTDMNTMFYITIIDQDLSNWNIGSILPNSSNFNWLKRSNYGSPFSTANYDAMLVAYEAQVPPVGLVWDIGSAKYTLGSAAETARTSLINTYGWTITDSGGIAARNTRIGGISAVLNTSANIASALGLTEPDITNVLVNNNDVLFDVGTTYTPPNTFKSNTTITAFDDRQGNVIGLQAQAFRGCSAINYLNFPSLTVLPDFTFEGLPNLVSADFISCTAVGGGFNFLSNSTATITVALSALTSNADGGPHQSLRVLNCTVDYDGYVDDGTWNTQVDGIAATENTRLLLANRLGCKTAALLNFQIVGNDVRAKVYGNYSINVGAFQSRTDITDFKDNDNKVINIKQNAFAYTTNYLNATFNGITSLVANNQFRNSAIDTIRMNALTTISGNYLARDTALLELFFPALINWNTNSLFYSNGNITNIEAPSLQTLGTTTGYDTAIGSALAFGGTVTVSDFLRTSNAGQPDGDLTWLIANRSANVVYIGEYTTNLVASYNFETNLLDYTGVNNGFPVGSPLAGNIGGVVGNDLLNNSSSLVNCGNDVSLQATQYSVSAWVKTNLPGSSYRGIVVKRNAFGIFLNNYVLGLYSWANNTIYSTGLNLADNNWHHVCVTIDDGVTNGTKIYVDGTLVSTITFGISNQSINLVLGAGDTITGQSLNGEIDEVHVWTNRLLNAAEVLNIYNTEISGTSILPEKKLLDNVTGAVAAYSLRELSDAYMGNPVVNVRRSSDNATQDFTSTEITDGTLLSFVGNTAADNGYVTTWHDQSGASNNLVQATQANQPKIVSSGVLVERNLKPAVEFDGLASNFLEQSTALSLTEADGFVIVEAKNYPPTRVNPNIYNESGLWGYSTSPFSNHYSWSDGSIYETFFTTSQVPIATPAVTLARLNLYNVLSKSNEYSAFLNSSQIFTTATNTVATAGPQRLGASQDSSNNRYYLDGYLSEFIIFNQDKSTDRAYIEANIMEEYSIYSDYTDGLVASYNFQADFTDYTGVNNGTAFGTPLAAQAGGIVGNCMLNNSTSYVDCGNDTSLNITTLTVSAWIKTSNAGSSYRGIVTKFGAWGILIKDQELGLYQYSTSTFIPTAVFVNTNTWTHVAVSIQDGVTSGAKIYIDGVLLAQLTFNFSSTGSNLVLGTASNGSQDYSGNIDEVHIWNKILNPVDIANIYNTENSGNSILP